MTKYLFYALIFSALIFTLSVAVASDNPSGKFDKIKIGGPNGLCQPDTEHVYEAATKIYYIYAIQLSDPCHPVGLVTDSLSLEWGIVNVTQSCVYRDRPGLYEYIQPDFSARLLVTLYNDFSHLASLSIADVAQSSQLKLCARYKVPIGTPTVLSYTASMDLTVNKMTGLVISAPPSNSLESSRYSLLAQQVYNNNKNIVQPTISEPQWSLFTVNLDGSRGTTVPTKVSIEESNPALNILPHILAIQSVPTGSTLKFFVVATLNGFETEKLITVDGDSNNLKIGPDSIFIGSYISGTNQEINRINVNDGSATEMRVFAKWGNPADSETGEAIMDVTDRIVLLGNGQPDIQVTDENNNPFIENNLIAHFNGTTLITENIDGGDKAIKIHATIDMGLGYTQQFRPYSRIPAERQVFTLVDRLESEGTLDTDKDGMPDYWEKKYGLDYKNPIDARWHNDSDGMTNLQEFELGYGTDPTKTDTDGDGINDNIEINKGSNPTDPYDPIVQVEVLVDTDGDGVFDRFDAFPNDPNEQYDTDGDGLGNNIDLDDDNDGISDEEEIKRGRHPQVNEAALMIVINRMVLNNNNRKRKVILNILQNTLLKKSSISQ